MRFNERLLRRLKAHWYCPGPFLASGMTLPETRERFIAGVIDHCQQQAAAELRRSYGTAARIVLKEPRLCLLWPLWEQALHTCGFSSHCVFIFRNPIEVAKSLQRRNAFELEKGLQLWLHCNLDALEAHVAGKIADFVSYEDLLAKPEETMRSLLRAVGTEESLQADAVAELRQFLTPEQRHHVVSAQDFDSSYEVPNLVREVYHALVEWRSIPRSEQLMRIARWRTEFDQFCLTNQLCIPLDFDSLPGVASRRAKPRAKLNSDRIVPSLDQGSEVGASSVGRRREKLLIARRMAEQEGRDWETLSKGDRRAFNRRARKHIRSRGGDEAVQLTQ